MSLGVLFGVCKIKKFFSDCYNALQLPIVDALGALIFYFLGTYVAVEYCAMSPDIPSFVCGFFLFIATDIWGSFLSKSFRKKEA